MHFRLCVVDNLRSQAQVFLDLTTSEAPPMEAAQKVPGLCKAAMCRNLGKYTQRAFVGFNYTWVSITNWPISSTNCLMRITKFCSQATLQIAGQEATKAVRCNV